jgi:steroid delta-isomerase-like uncharacterized protein
MSTETNKAIIARMIEQVWNEGRTDLVEEFFTEDCVQHIVGMPQALGLDALKQNTAMGLTAWADFHLGLDEAVAEGDMVAARWTTTGKHVGDLLGIPATGKQVSQCGTTFYRLENGRIAEIWFLADMLGLMQQLGVIPTAEAI